VNMELNDRRSDIQGALAAMSDVLWIRSGSTGFSCGFGRESTVNVLPLPLRVPSLNRGGGYKILKQHGVCVCVCECVRLCECGVAGTGKERSGKTRRVRKRKN
jgi:hypothetical protein